jgi:hypothetical protein
MIANGVYFILLAESISWCNSQIFDQILKSTFSKMGDRLKAKMAMISHIPPGNDVIISYDPEDRNYVLKIRGL